MIPANASSTPSPVAALVREVGAPGHVDAEGALVFRVVARLDVSLDEARLANGALADDVDLELQASDSQGPASPLPASKALRDDYQPINSANRTLGRDRTGGNPS